MEVLANGIPVIRDCDVDDVVWAFFRADYAAGLVTGDTYTETYRLFTAAIASAFKVD